MGVGSLYLGTVVGWRSVDFKIPAQLAHLVIFIRDILCWHRWILIWYVILLQLILVLK